MASEFKDFEACLVSNDLYPFVFEDPNRAIRLINELKIIFECDVVVWDVSNYEFPETTDKENSYFLPGIAVEVGL